MNNSNQKNDDILLLKNKISELETSLSEQKQIYEDLFDNAPDMYFTIDQNGNVLSVNKNGANYLGYKRSELIGEKVWKVVYNNDLARVKKQLKKLLNQCNQNFELEFRKIKRNGSIIFVHERIRCIVNENNGTKEMRIVCRDISDQKKTHQKLLDYQENLKTMTHELNSIEERTKQQIATKLHDDIGQAMALSKITLSNVSKNMTFDEINQKIETVKSLLTDAIRNSRDLTYEISPPVLHELGLGEAVKWYVKQIRKIFDIKFQIRGVQETTDLPDDSKNILYRSIVELINNIIKHSDASLVNITFNKFTNMLRIVVKDNGVGFKDHFEQSLSNDKKFGLFSTNERIKYVGGEFKIDSQVKKGTKITIKLPN